MKEVNESKERVRKGGIRNKKKTEREKLQREIEKNRKEDRYRKRVRSERKKYIYLFVDGDQWKDRGGHTDSELCLQQLKCTFNVFICLFVKVYLLFMVSTTSLSAKMQNQPAVLTCQYQNKLILFKLGLREALPHCMHRAQSFIKSHVGYKRPISLHHFVVLSATMMKPTMQGLLN